MSSLPSKGQRKRLTLSKLPIKKVAPGAIAAPEELLASDLTKVVPLMFDRRAKPEVKKAPLPPTKPVKAITVSKGDATNNVSTVAEKEEDIITKAPVAKIVSVPEAAVEPQEAPKEPQEAPKEPQIPPPSSKTIKLRRPKKRRYSEHLETVKKEIQSIEQSDPYTTNSDVFIPENRKGFSSFIVKTFGDFALPPKLGAPDLEACNRLGAAGEDATKMYLYQQFIREYIRQLAPYRGVLVYHGLGSGKTCSAIAAMEALYGTFGKKIIVMTPFSLQNNFITEITFCGFRHFRLQNHWVKVSIEEDPTATLFAQEVLGLPATYFKKTMKTIYVPDFTQTANYDSLPDQDKSQIREQIFAIIRNRIRFISYNGIRASQLKVWACSEPDFFDNAVIIIDEIHNLTRLMQGTIEPYLITTPGQRRRIPAEPITPGRWKPSLCNVSANYKRAFLFYKLLCGAKNSKIIGLSGTPLVNFPEELGIMANILHGYNDCVEVPVTAIKGATTLTVDQMEREFIIVAKKHPRVDFYSFTRTNTNQVLFFSRVREGYVKVFDTATGTLKGLEYVGDDEGGASIGEIFDEVAGELRTKGFEFGAPEFRSEPILNPDSESFTKNFIDTNSLKVTNEIVLSKRLSGLISYYKGSKEEFMPRIVRDELINIPFTDYSLVGYLAARKYEQTGEKKAEESGVGGKKLQSAWQEVLGIAKMGGNASSYRFRSRACCNFVFPESIKRPFPGNITELKNEIGKEPAIVSDQEFVTEDDEKASVAAEAEDAAVDTAEGVVDAAAIPLEEQTYQEQIKRALGALRGIKTELVIPTLAKYSPKYAAILEKIESIHGSALVYSQFRTLEGIGVFGIALEANGYIPIEIIGSDADPYFSPITEASFMAHFKKEESVETDNSDMVSNGDATNDASIVSKGDATNDVSTVVSSNSEEDSEEGSESPLQAIADRNAVGQAGGAPPKKRYILYSGEETRERRSLLIDLFNARFDRLPPRIAKVLRESGFETVANTKGDLCKVICITGAGAEGLSLKNVRSVHIMEPFWNPVRTDQVKGRAVRICSHADLPIEERTVEVYTYMAIVSQDAIAKKLVDESFLIMDGGITSDQKIQQISDRKKKVNDDLLRVMKQSAVDCNLNSTENNTAEETVRCFVIKGTVDEFLYDPRIDKDIVETERAQKFTVAPIPVRETTGIAPPQTAKYTVIGIKGKQYIAQPEKDNTFGLYNVRDRLFEKRLGTRTLDPATGKYKSVFVAPKN